jgi:hypothetical protein
MKKLTLLLALIFLFGGLSYAGTHQTSSIKRHKSGSYTIIGENRSNTYDKYGKKKSSRVKDFSGNTTITKYDNRGNKTKTTIRKPNGSSRTYDQKGKLIKRTDVTNY